jgi:hypothetical protein
MAMILVTNLSRADILSFENGSDKLESHILAKSAKAIVDGKEQVLPIVGAGLRTKKVVFIHVKVYVGEIFTDDLTKVERSSEKALESISNQRFSALRLSFLRSVDAEKIETSFVEALAANSVSKTDQGVSEFLAAVKSSGEAKEGKAMLFLFKKESEQTESIEFQNGDSKPSKATGPKGLIKKILSIWLGTPADDALAKMKSEILH